MTTPAITDFDRYVATPLTNTNWDNNCQVIVNYLTSGTRDVTFQSVTTTSGVTVAGALAVTGTIGTTTGIISGDGSGLTNLPNNFYDRGDPATTDYQLSTFTTTSTVDGNYHDLDLSALVPAGAKAVLLRTYILDNVSAGDGRYVAFRENGNSNSHNESRIAVQSLGVTSYADLVVSLDSNRFIEYKFTALPTSFYITVAGYWK